MSAFLQTLLWVALIAWALLRFEKVIGALVGAVTKRIEDGDELAAPGGFRIGVRQVSAGEQRDQLHREAEEAVRNSEAESEGQAEPAVEANQHPVGDNLSGGVAHGGFNALAGALRDVSDAKTLGLKWLGMAMGGQILPNVKVGDISFDGLLKFPDGGPRALVVVKLVNSLSHLPSIVEQVKAMANLKRLPDSRGPLRISVVLVRSDRLANEKLWPYIASASSDEIDWREIDLPQLRAMYGLNVGPGAV